MDIIIPIINYLMKVLVWTFNQIIILIGPLLLLAFIMQIISSLFRKISSELFGFNFYVYSFGWLGVPVHELGHALFAVLFGHKIHKLVLFSPNFQDGLLGYVNHSYNPKNFYHVIGNLFIGIGPIIFGSSLLSLLALILFGANIFYVDYRELNFGILIDPISFKIQIMNFWNSMIEFMSHMINADYSLIKIIIFAYAIFAIGGNMTLSPSDIKSSYKGFIYFAVILFLFNLCSLWAGDFLTMFFTQVSKYISVIYYFIMLSIFLNTLIIILSLIILAMKNLIKVFH